MLICIEYPTIKTGSSPYNNRIIQYTHTQKRVWNGINHIQKRWVHLPLYFVNICENHCTTYTNVMYTITQLCNKEFNEIICNPSVLSPHSIVTIMLVCANSHLSVIHEETYIFNHSPFTKYSVYKYHDTHSGSTEYLYPNMPYKV